MNLTAQKVATLELDAGKQDQIWFDDSVPGFGLRIRETGSRSWIFQYKIGRKTRRVVIGRASAIKVGRAREMAGELHAKVRLGGDPAAEKRVQVERASHTLGGLTDKYLAQQEHRAAPRQLPGGQASPSGACQAAARSACRYDRQANRSRPVGYDREELGAVTANRVRASMSAMFTWGMKEGLVLANPVMFTNKRQCKVCATACLRTLNWRCIWQGLQTISTGPLSSCWYSPRSGRTKSRLCGGRRLISTAT